MKVKINESHDVIDFGNHLDENDPSTIVLEDHEFNSESPLDFRVSKTEKSLMIIPVPNLERKKIKRLGDAISHSEAEVAQLWYDNMLKDMKIESTESEVAQLWYELMMGGI